MKSILTLTLLISLGLGFAASARPVPRARSHRPVSRGGLANNIPPDSTNRPPNSIYGLRAAAHAARLYAAVFPYDLNGDGQLDAAEQAALINDLTNGTAHPFGNTNMVCLPPPELATNLATRVAVGYAVIAPFDLNRDGQLDSAEEASLGTALLSGSVKLALFEGSEEHGEMEAIRQHLLALYDANGDGQLDSTELAALEADLLAGNIQLPQPAAHPHSRTGRRR